LAGGAGLAVSLVSSIHLQAEEEVQQESRVQDMAGSRLEGLPEFSREQVGEHDSVVKRVWVTYRSGVYDITDFIPMHPGAEKLLMAAGAGVEPFWAMYAFHLKDLDIMKMLEKFRIGNLAADDVEDRSESDNPFSNDPKRHPALIVNNPTPFNAETPLAIIADSFLTPTELFYVRNHLPVPEVDPDTYELEVVGLGVKEEGVTFSLEQLKQFPQHTIVATVQCAGNRRAEMKAKKNLKGLGWRGGAIGNAEWTGVRLADVLEAAGFTESKFPNARHVHLEGLDVDPANDPYAASIPVEKAADPRGDVLLAFKMNGETLPRDHGFPVRVIVPGVAGVRNVKWLGRVEVSETESDSHHQTHDYKGFHPSTDWDTVDWEKSEAIQDMPVTSAITTCRPSPDTPGEMLVSGYAWSGGGRKILRVDLTGDGGHTWTQAHRVESW